jgi:hypothetical protein
MKVSNRKYFIMFAVIVILSICFMEQKKQEPVCEGFSHRMNNAHSHTIEEGEHRCGNKKAKLLPIMDPLFNLREVCKNCVLLEDHLNNERKRCKDCIRKHMLLIEGLLEEAISLDKDNKYNLNKYPDEFRNIEKRWIEGEDECKVAQNVRKIRKNFVSKCFNNI